ncbi:MAG: Rieske (2Fe-2S) protein [Candidatus Sphingomonas phytovorans]|nr:Rieske (2Fe-2S) protein [Sphingomonas sp.]WEK01143.1 MAG: Rieske (2Fe-2S) protein [Sphingomonas sp.]
MNADLRVYATPAGITLGSLDLIQTGAARSFVVQLEGGRFHGFVVRRGESVFGYVDRCPHMGVPLAQVLDDYLTPAGDLVVCSWHCALFEVETGRCIGGPCNGARLTAWPVQVREGAIVTGGAA